MLHKFGIIYTRKLLEIAIVLQDNLNIVGSTFLENL